MDHFGIKRTKNQTNKQTKTVIAVSTTVISNISSTMVTKYLQFRTSLYTDIVLFFFLVVVLLAREWSERERKKNKKKLVSVVSKDCYRPSILFYLHPYPFALAVNKSPSVFTFITPVRRIIPWVPEVFLACGVNFRCLPKADTSSAVGRSHELDRNRKPR